MQARDGTSSERVDVRVPAALRPYVDRVGGYREEGLSPGLHRGLPSPSLTLVVTVDDPLVLQAHPDPRQPPSSHDALVGGLHLRPALIAHPGRQCGVQLSLTPLGARALLGVPAAALASWDADLADVLGRPAGELVDRLREATDWAGRLRAVRDVLLGQLRPEAALAPEVAEAWRLTTAGRGSLRVREVADRVGWSPRRLTERVRAETGLTPKQVARVARFDAARRALAGRAARGLPLDLAGSAPAWGYADQAHLTREWRDPTGLPPTAWLRAEHLFVQDGRGDGAAGSAPPDTSRHRPDREEPAR